jgi:hypothetical protein
MERVAWIVLDPKTSEVGVYPRDVAQKVEEAWRGREESFSMYGLGLETVVYLNHDHLFQQTTNKGRCDVQRIVITGCDARPEVTVHVYREEGRSPDKPGSWRFTEDPTLLAGEELRSAEERRLLIHPTAIITQQQAFSEF